MSEVASAYVSLLPSAKGFGSKLDSQIGPSVAASGKKHGLSFGKLFAFGAAAAVGKKAFDFLGDSLAEARDAQVVGSRTENVIKKMGGAANISADQVGKLAGAISNKTGIDDEAIQSGQNLLLTFGNVRNEVGKGNDIFSQTSQLMVDMSAAMGTDAKGSAIQLGKALNDPIKGLSALSRVGVSFTKGQQDQIKAMVASGHTMAAQKVILGELDKQFGGAAAAMTSPAEKAAVAWGNFKEELGTRLLPIVDRLLTVFVNKGLPAVTSFAAAASTFLKPVLHDIGGIIATVIVPAITAFIAGMQNGSGAGGQFAATMQTAATALNKVSTFIQNNKTAVGTFVAIVGTAVVVTKAWAAAQALLNVVLSANPIGVIVVAIAGLAAGIVYAYKRSETFRKIVDAAFANVKVGAAALAAVFAVKVVPGFNKIINAATTVLNWARNNWPTIQAILTNPFAVAAVAIGESWNKIKAGGVTVLTWIKTLPVRVTAVFAGMAAGMLAAGVKLMQSLAAGIKAGASKYAVPAAVGVAQLIKGLLPGSPIKWGPLKNWNGGGAGKRLMNLVADGIVSATPRTVKAAEDAFGKIKDKLEGQRDKIHGTLDGLKSDFAGLSDSVKSAFTGNLFEATTASDFVANLTAKKAELTGLLASFKTLKGWGLDPAFLSQLFASGNGALITELAGMGKAGAVDAGALFGDVSSLGTQLGDAVATNDYGPKIDTTNRKLTRVNEQLSYLAEDIGKVLNGAAAKGHRNKKGGK